MKIIPAIDIINGKTVRLEQGRYDKKLSYKVEPVDAAKEWEAMGAELIHVVDLDGAGEGRPVNLSTISRIVKAVNIPVEIGGGFRNELDIKRALDSGVWRVVIGSKAFEDIDFARDCLENFQDKIILSMDARGFKPQIHGWKEELDLDMFDILERFVSFGAKEIIYTDVQKDGMLSGPGIEELRGILERIYVKIVSAGGIKTIEHIEELKKLEHLGVTGAIVGRALYEGTINLKEAIDAGKTNNSMP
ncbi:MAG: 1-(5-phosphoribosyl)-5-[(5-phosphoribosylamino)methylideneamino]imidazole-4-carboxamide isomerase [Candidatus Omnitrophota bacterium]